MQDEIYLEAMRAKGLADATNLQKNSAEMDGTTLYKKAENIPDFAVAKTVKNMLERSTGFVCRSSAGRMVRLLQVYDSDTFPQEPEDLPAQWGFAWSTEPTDALPFIAMSTSPYGEGDCCTYAGHVWRSGQSGNVWPPETPGVSWEDLGTIESVQTGA